MNPKHGTPKHTERNQLVKPIGGTRCRARKLAGGAVVNGEDAKTHPCMMPFNELPREQQMKDRLFIGIVRALSIEILDTDENQPPLESE